MKIRTFGHCAMVLTATACASHPAPPATAAPTPHAGSAPSQAATSPATSPASMGIQASSGDSMAGQPVYFDFQVEKPVAARPTNQPPEFPPEARGVSKAVVIVSFVVDTTGAPEMRTFQLVTSDGDLFAIAVRRAVAKDRFYPAEIAGRKVRQRVQMPFYFSH
jgi:outer membrane biosynthesis protein TonB